MRPVDRQWVRGKLLDAGSTQHNPAKAIWYQTDGGFLNSVIDNCSLTCAGARSDPGGFSTTSGSTTVADTHAVFGDIGLPISQANIPVGTTITAVTPGVGYTISQAATATTPSGGYIPPLSVGGATISPWYVNGFGGGFNSVVFRQLWCAGGYTSAVPFFSIDAGTVVGRGSNIVFESIVFELCVGGSIYVTGCSAITLDKCAHWDSYVYANTYSFGVSAGGYPCLGITVRQSGVVTYPGSGSGPGWYDIYAASACTNIL